MWSLTQEYFTALVQYQGVMDNMSKQSICESVMKTSWFIYTDFQGIIKQSSSFDQEKDAEHMRRAMKGIVCDTKVILEIVSSRCNTQRQEISKAYKEAFERDLISDLKRELRSDFGHTVMFLFHSPIEFDVHCLYKALSGMRTDEEALIEILASRKNEDIRNIKLEYLQKYNIDLENTISSDANGMFSNLLGQLAKASRDESTIVDHDLAKEDALKLIKTGVKSWRKDKPTVNDILCNRSFVQLRATFHEYSLISGRNFLTTVKSEFCADKEAGLLAIVEIIQYTPAYFAKRLYRAMKGVGTDDNTLIRVMVSRAEIDMVEIKLEFENTYGKPLSSYIMGDTSGDYEKLLISLTEE